jgi:hypothetical protein
MSELNVRPPKEEEKDLGRFCYWGAICGTTEVMPSQDGEIPRSARDEGGRERQERPVPELHPGRKQRVPQNDRMLWWWRGGKIYVL